MRYLTLTSMHLEKGEGKNLNLYCYFIISNFRKSNVYSLLIGTQLVYNHDMSLVFKRFGLGATG